jgi:hypothetical protein
MPNLYSTLLCGGVLIAAALIYMGLYLLRRARRLADERVPRNGSDRENSGGRVLWDVRGRTSKLVIRDGVVYMDRRSALVRGFRSVLAIVGIAAVGRSAGAVSELLQGDEKKPIANGSGKHTDVPGKHTDVPGKHTDVPAKQTNVAGKHTDIPHSDETGSHRDPWGDADDTPHTDTPHSDAIDDQNKAIKGIIQNIPY